MEVYNASQRSNWDSEKLFLKISIDCGDDNPLLNENMNLVLLMKKKHIPFEFRVREDSHNCEYWRSGLELAFVFIGDVFRE